MKSSFHYLKQLVKGTRSAAVLDDCFPNLLTGFRVAEYNWYLERFPKLKIYSSNSDFISVHAEYAKIYPQYADRVIYYDESCLKDCGFVYVNFLNNAYKFLPALTIRRIPFFFTLYPGGGFGLNDPESDAKLNLVLNSPLLCGVIATQSVTLHYLKSKNCKVPVYDIYGGAMNPIYFESDNINQEITRPSSALSICFVADKYMPHGANKGYPQFIEVIKHLVREFPDLIISVVGGFSSEDYPIDDKTIENIVFKGFLFTTELKDFFMTQDLIISPNLPFLLTKGNFDGFPTGCCIEASLCGVAVVCSDELKLNRYYTNGIDMIICEPKPESIIKEVLDLIRNPNLLKKIGDSGKKVSQVVFDPKRQLDARADLLEKYANMYHVKLQARPFFRSFFRVYV